MTIKLVSHKDESVIPLPSAKGAVAIQHLSKHYRLDGRDLPVLQDINLDIQPGEFISIVGRSGCGKSTLLRLILGLESGYQGNILVDGDQVHTTSLDRGIVFQEASLLPWMTLQQNVAFALLTRNDLSDAEKERRVLDRIKLVNLAGFETAYPKELSGGMAQRTAIARALVNEPKVMLLDEPFGALDALTRGHLQREVQKIWLQHRSTMIMVTHDVEEAVFLGNRVVIMDARPGRIRRIVNVPLPQPRDTTSRAFQHIKEEILADLMEGGIDGNGPE